MGIISSCLEAVVGSIFHEYLVRKPRENNVDCLLCAISGGIEKRRKTSGGQKPKRWVSEIRVENFLKITKYPAFIVMTIIIFRLSVSITVTVQLHILCGAFWHYKKILCNYKKMCSWKATDLSGS